MNKDFLVLTDFTTEKLTGMLELGERVKRSPKDYRTALEGKSLGMIFAKKSTRTRLSFEVGFQQLGGQAIFLGPDDMQLSRGETIADTARVLSRYLDAIMIRTFAHNDVQELARHATIPVINGLTDFNHPCQALSDIMTIREKLGRLEGLKLAYIGDGNNVAVSLMFACVKFGLDISIISPRGYTINKDAVKMIEEEANKKNIQIVVTEDIEDGVQGAHIVYTDVWASMGQEDERKKRLHDLADYAVTEEVMNQADPAALFMHCLPAHRGEEVSASVIDGPASIVFDQAENRLHMQKGILLTLMSPEHN